MLPWLIAAAAGFSAAGVQYGTRTLAPTFLPLALLRALAAMLIVALLLGAPAGRASTPLPQVALDASESWLRAADSTAWHAANDSARTLGGPAVRVFGDSLRDTPPVAAPRDHASRARAVVDAATGAGRPVILVTDGELEDGDALSGLPRGSRVVALAKREGPDAAVTQLDAPHALLVGDTLQARITVASGGAGAPGGVLTLALDAQPLDSVAIPALGPYTERVVTLRGLVRGAERGSVLRASVRAAGDREPRNDTLALGVDVTKAPAAVFISTAPDYDAREAVGALRGVTSLPTRAFYRVAPGMWRTDGTLERVDEKVVRDAAHDAPMVVLHGDTSVFGAPRAATRGALLLFAPPAADDGEWFASAAPASPIAPLLSSIPFDSLPPLSVGPALPVGEWQGLVTHRGGAPEDKRIALVGWEAPRRIAVLGASGFWRWRFRGGARSDAFNALFGALYDWLAAGRTDRRAVVPSGDVIREGAPIRWRRGAPADSVAAVVLAQRGTRRADTLHVQFAASDNSAETAPLARGTYDVTTAGGTSVIVVNASSELVPRRPTIRSGAVGGEPALGEAPSLREYGWVYALAILLLCAEWLLRRRVGLR